MKLTPNQRHQLVTLLLDLKQPISSDEFSRLIAIIEQPNTDLNTEGVATEMVKVKCTELYKQLSITELLKEYANLENIMFLIECSDDEQDKIGQLQDQIRKELEIRKKDFLSQIEFKPSLSEFY